MGIITLTDRISVRVSAKNDTQSNDYKKATGGAIASKLGNGNVSDSLKSQLGNTKNPTITDENGDTWVSMEDMIDAGKAMNGDGAFDEEKEKYTIKNSGKSFYKVSYVKLWNANEYKNPPESYSFVEYSGDVYINAYRSTSGFISYVVCDGYPSASSSPKLISKTEYYKEDSNKTTTNISGEQTSRQNISNPSLVFPDNTYYASDSEIRSALNSNNYSKETSGGSSYDWTKSDAEIEEDIRDQEEIWDVIQNAVSSSSSTAKIPVGPYVNVGHIDDSWDSGSGGGHTGGDF